ncbi:MAG: hypothetical protein COB54_03510 [Alphaproteobacteria bacterium]|nr:MAG: hypothetical protein COB54_03510 [Alphaproteobacteria bacterium]
MHQIDWARYAEIAYVNFGWSPDQFWRATPADFWCAYAGWRKVRGGSGEAPLSRSELNDLVSRQVKA